mmetsp:Transcript_8757/g.10692  ORF Transcript_8757/g.10692 Transcript_8757/m.10692 type:complete len:93 (+) Transcript_8757:22-300(+)
MTKVLWLSLLIGVLGVEEDQNENCDYWSSIGECEKNPGYMLTSCAKSCSRQLPSGPIPSSFYELSAYDAYGSLIDFANLREKVILITNVASE